MQREKGRDCHTEWSQSDREEEISYDIPSMGNLKRNDTNDLSCKTETDSENELTVARQRGRMRGRDSYGVWAQYVYTAILIKWIACKDLLYSIGSSAQCYVTVGIGGEF